jgi:hypothetical protein
MRRFVDLKSLAAVRSRILFYPAAGSDWNEFIEAFADHIDEFHFCDVTYCDLNKLEHPFFDPKSYELIDTKVDGKAVARMDTPTPDRPYCSLTPGRLTEIYKRVSDGREVKVVRRRGFGQYALAEFSDSSIGVFVHRGDSPGEGGSSAYFLDNKKRDHEPLGNLYDKLSQKLTDPAIVISDGSNARPKFLKKFHRREISDEDAFSRLHKRCFSFGKLRWTCIGYFGRRYGPTLVWRVFRHHPDEPAVNL